MPFGNLNSTYRLGIANTYLANKYRWAREVLRLSIETFPQPFPVYQGMLVHAVNHWSTTSAVAAEQCWASAGDSEDSLSHVMRQTVAYDTFFSRKNITPGVQNVTTPQYAYSLNIHSSNRYGQMYFVQNEPESVDFPQYIGDVQTCIDIIIPGGDSGNPRNNSIDPVIDTLGVIPYIEFWEEPNGNSARRAYATALALVFLRIKRILEAQNRGHVVIAPAPSAPTLGAISGNPYSTYWAAFYNAIQNGASVTAPISGQPSRKEQENGTPPKDLKVLHLHHYSPPRGMPEQANAPLESVAEGAYALKLGVDWFRQQYNKNSQGQQIGALDMDILLSEFGTLWQIPLSVTNSKHKWAWAGGWNNFRDSLSWWNSWLCWLMRRAHISSECNLATSPSARTLYACIHTPDNVPYSTRETFENTSEGTIWSTTNYGRNQNFFNADLWTTGTVLNSEIIVVNQLISSGRFERSFSSFYPTSWDYFPGTSSNTQWRIGPLGACYKVWSQVASDPSSTTFGAGWYSNSAGGTNIGETTIDLPGGYCTVYFPVIKSFGAAFDANTRFNIVWRKSGRPDYSFGYFDANEFPDSQTVNQIHYNFNTSTYGPLVGIPTQTIYSSMIFPVVCFSASPQTVTVRLSRNIGGTYVSLGRPIVFRQACSWLSNQ